MSVGSIWALVFAGVVSLIWGISCLIPQAGHSVGPNPMAGLISLMVGFLVACALFEQLEKL
jgi:hypothetical protein